MPAASSASSRSTRPFIPTSACRALPTGPTRPPAGFIFTVKGPKFITHQLKLRNAAVPLANFMATGVLRLGEKLGPFIWQLPGNLHYDRERHRSVPRPAAAHSGRCRDPRRQARRSPQGRSVHRNHRHQDRPPRHRGAARELRQPRLHRRCLRAHNVALVIADTADWPYRDLTADFAYLRLQGPADPAAPAIPRPISMSGRSASRPGRRASPSQTAPISSRPRPTASKRDVFCLLRSREQDRRAEERPSRHAAARHQGSGGGRLNARQRSQHRMPSFATARFGDCVRAGWTTTSDRCRRPLPYPSTSSPWASRFSSALSPSSARSARRSSAGWCPANSASNSAWPIIGACRCWRAILLLWNRLPLTVWYIAIAIVAAIFVWGAYMGVYHAGVEWGFWPGPTACTGTGAEIDFDDLSGDSTPVIGCDVVQFRFLGISLAGYNALISLAIVALLGVAVVGTGAGGSGG